MGKLSHISPTPVMPAVTRILASYDRPQVEAFIEIAVALLDTIDAPADPETPDFRRRSDGLPGEPADQEPASDDRDTSWPEWNQRRLRKVTSVGHEMAGERGLGACEDDEEDNSDRGEDEAEPDYARHLVVAGPGCMISDPDYAVDDKPCDDDGTA